MMFSTTFRTALCRSFLSVLLIAGVTPFAASKDISDACNRGIIHSTANVTTSAGAHYSVETVFKDVHNARTAFTYPDRTLNYNTEGPVSWVTEGDSVNAGDDNLTLFTLGHHSVVIAARPELILEKTELKADIVWRGQTVSKAGWSLRGGGMVYLFQDEKTDRIDGYVLRLPDGDIVRNYLSDWRQTDIGFAPFKIVMEHGETQFNYQYNVVTQSGGTLRDYFDDQEGARPQLAGLYRLHAETLLAHCEGDAAAFASLMADEGTIVQSGKISHITNENLRERFSGVFQAVDYMAYENLSVPEIRLSDDGSLGWIIAHVKPQTVDAQEQESETIWTWMMGAALTDSGYKWHVLSSSAAN
jgi:hypothetical protein